MGLRFRKAISLIPGVRLNISKQGVSSLSLGGRGFTYNIGKKGTRATGGLPGTGLSYSHYDKYAGGDAQHPRTQEVVDHETGEITQAPAQPSSTTASPFALLANLPPMVKVLGFAALALAVNYFKKH